MRCALYVVGDHAAPGGELLLSPDHLHELVPDVAERDVYVCGPPGDDRLRSPERPRARAFPAATSTSNASLSDRKEHACANDS